MPGKRRDARPAGDYRGVRRMMGPRCSYQCIRTFSAACGILVDRNARVSLTQSKEVMGMPFVIAEPCIDVQDQACVSVCPVACIHFDAGKDRKLYIDPNECIDCGACEPACPVEAIFAELDLPYKWAKYEEIDALWYRDKEAARAMVEVVKTKA
jgi:NAD-dependent dihydropyrimidine dehydrogenase PreA subunit